MNSLLIETCTIKTFLKISSYKHSLGNFFASLSSQFPKARNLKQRSLKKFVLQLFSKFMLIFPTPMGYC